MSGYGTDGGLSEYASATGRPLVGSPAIARTVGSAFIDGWFGERFPGTRTGGFAQARVWPRVGAVTAEGQPIPSDVVPEAVIQASYEAALRHDARPGSLTPDTGRHGPVKRIGAGSASVEFADNTSPGGGRHKPSAFPAIDALLSGLIVRRLPGVLVV